MADNGLPFEILRAYENEPLGPLIAEYLGMEVCPTAHIRHPGPGIQILGTPQTFGGETKSVVGRNVANKRSFVTLSVANTNDELKQAELLGDALRWSCESSSVNLVSPYVPYSREDQTYEQRGPLSIAAVARGLAAYGYTRLVAVDLHSEASEGGIRNAGLKLRHLKTRPLLSHYVANTLFSEIGSWNDFSLGAPDASALKTVEKIMKELPNDQLSLLFAHKRRSLVTGAVEGHGIYHVEGDSVEGKFVLFSDDILGSGSTIFQAAEAAKNEGAKYVAAYCTHPFGFDDRDENGITRLFFDKLHDSALDLLIVTNSRPQFQERLTNYLRGIPDRERAAGLSEKVRIMDILPYLGEAIKRVGTGSTIREMITELGAGTLYRIIKGQELLEETSV